MNISALRLSTLFLILPLAACSPEADSPPSAESATEPSAATTASPALNPLPGMEGQVPELSESARVRMSTTAGDLLIEIYPQAAPHAAERFLTLVETGFYDNTPVSRVVPGFVAQFGVNWREGHREWQDRNFNDDPSLFALEPGTLAFAKAGPNTNSTQVFINYTQNNHLAEPRYNFTVFGKVIEGMDTVESFVQVGDPQGGLDQGRLWSDGEAYLASLSRQPTMIEDAEIVD